MSRKHDRQITGLDAFTPRSILVCQLRQIGDVLLATPTVRVLRTLFPDASIDFYTEKKCAPVLVNHPDINRVWVVDRSLGFLDSLKFYRNVGRAGHDMIVDCQQLPRIMWMLLFSRAKVKLTYSPPWYRRFFYTHWSPPIGPYAAQCKASPLLQIFGEHLWDDPRPRLYLSDKERAWASDYLTRAGIRPTESLVTVDPSHRRATRRWPAEHFARLMELTLEKRPDLRFLLLYGPGEEGDARQAFRAMRRKDRCLVPEELLDLRQMAAIMDQASFHLGNCSAPAHFAAALDVPSLIIKGATSEAWTCPTDLHQGISLGLDCQPCNTNTCRLGTCPCLTNLLPETVADRLLTLLPPAKA